jgi:hypothetical protein
LKSTKSQALGDDAKAKAHMGTLMKSKRNEVETIIIMQAQVEEMYYFNLEFRYVALSRGMLHGLLTSLSAQNSR